MFDKYLELIFLYKLLWETICEKKYLEGNI